MRGRLRLLCIAALCCAARQPRRRVPNAPHTRALPVQLYAAGRHSEARKPCGSTRWRPQGSRHGERSQLLEGHGGHAPVPWQVARQHLPPDINDFQRAAAGRMQGARKRALGLQQFCCSSSSCWASSKLLACALHVHGGTVRMPTRPRHCCPHVPDLRQLPGQRPHRSHAAEAHVPPARQVAAPGGGRGVGQARGHGEHDVAGRAVHGMERPGEGGTAVCELARP